MSILDKILEEKENKYLNKLYTDSNFIEDLTACPKCGGKLTVRKKRKLTRKDLRKQWFYTQFIKCSKCSYIKLDNEYRIMNTII